VRGWFLAQAARDPSSLASVLAADVVLTFAGRRTIGPEAAVAQVLSMPSAPPGAVERNVLPGADNQQIETLQVLTEAEAAREHFIGSPTIRVNGRDIVPDTITPTALTCRLYHRRDGRPSPLPDPADLREVIAATAVHPLDDH
jgi:hypothetical protein